jgi:hypothetical protein
VATGAVEADEHSLIRGNNSAIAGVGRALEGRTRSDDRSWSSDTTLFSAVLAAHQTVSRYLRVRIDLGSSFSAAQSLTEARALQRDAHHAITGVVRVLRARGARPEYMLIRLKELIATLPRIDYDEWEALRCEVIRWAIEEYYAAGNDSSE